MIEIMNYNNVLNFYILFKLIILKVEKCNMKLKFNKIKKIKKMNL